jgi:hypothetical protein
MEVEDILAAWVEGKQRSGNALAPATLKVHANLANKHAFGQTCFWADVPGEDAL